MNLMKPEKINEILKRLDEQRRQTVVKRAEEERKRVKAEVRTQYRD